MGKYNQFIHRRKLTDPTQRAITATNNDCLVSNARIDLSGGPLELDIPDITGRYFSVAFMDAFTDNFRFIGTRATKGRGGRFLLAPPRWTGSADVDRELIVAPTTDVWILARILVDGPTDVVAVNELQDALGLRALPTNRPLVALPVAPADGRDPANLLAVASVAIARIPANDPRVRRAARNRAVGLERGAADPFSRLDPTLQQKWRDELPRLEAALAKPRPGSARVCDGWSYSAAALGRFGANDFLRAQVALVGLAALPPEEAFYAHALTDRDGAPLNGAHAYRLRIPAGGPPVDAFWSITMYQVEADGRLFLAPNPIDRYSIGDRTPGLTIATDGSLEILLQHAPPAPGEQANWLPVPPGPFRPAFRGYLAKPTLRNLDWRLPPVERIA